MKGEKYFSDYFIRGNVFVGELVFRTKARLTFFSSEKSKQKRRSARGLDLFCMMCGDKRITDESALLVDCWRE